MAIVAMPGLKAKGKFFRYRVVELGGSACQKNLIPGDFIVDHWHGTGDQTWHLADLSKGASPTGFIVATLEGECDDSGALFADGRATP